MIRAASFLFVGCFLFTRAVSAKDAPAFTPSEVERILAHGPWPLPAARDPSNRVSGAPAAIVLGERLFFSPRLSGTGSVLCASCHEPWRSYTDGRARAFGLAPVDRNTPTLFNVRLNRWFGWDGSNDNLWGQSIRPLLEPREMHSSAARVGGLVRGDPELAAAYRKAFGVPPEADDETLLAGVGKALAAYQETLASGRTPFDEFRDALAREDAEAAGHYPREAQRGLKIFLGAGGCAACHSGPDFSDGTFHRVGVASRRGNGEPDTGREGGIRKLLASPFNLLGSYNDDRLRSTAVGTQRAAADADAAGAFRTPGLREVARTAPYMHDGSLATLCAVLERHPEGASALLSAWERSELVAFLNSLSAPPAAGEAQPCP